LKIGGGKTGNARRRNQRNKVQEQAEIYAELFKRMHADAKVECITITNEDHGWYDLVEDDSTYDHGFSNKLSEFIRQEKKKIQESYPCFKLGDYGFF